jgi:hypothetical protein
MALLSGQSENGWKKSIIKGDIIQYETVLTHGSGTSSNQVTGLFPSEVINHIFKQFSNIFINVAWGAAGKTTTVNLVLVEGNGNQVLQTRELFASASRVVNSPKSISLIPKNLYSADGAFLDTTNILSPYIFIQDLASGGTTTPSVTIQIHFASDNIQGIKDIGETL